MLGRDILHLCSEHQARCPMNPVEGQTRVDYCWSPAAARPRNVEQKETRLPCSTFFGYTEGSDAKPHYFQRP